MALTQVPIELSSTPGIVDNSNATAITIDSSENVGIGCTPSRNLDIQGTGDTLVSIISPAANFLLFLNLFISLNVCLIAVLHESFNLEELVFNSFLMLSIFFLFQQLSFRLSSFLLGEPGLTKNMSVITQQIWNFLGLVIFLLALLILLNTQHAEIFRIFVYFILFLLPFARIVKGVIYAKSNNYDWFYIILYLCTLEILPLVVLGKYFRELF